MSDIKLLFQFEISENDFSNLIELRDDLDRIVRNMGLESDNELSENIESYHKLLDSLKVKGKANHGH